MNNVQPITNASEPSNVKGEPQTQAAPETSEDTKDATARLVAVGSTVLLDGTVEIPYELNHVDADIRDYYVANLPARYIAGIPIKIQISRLLTKLNDRNHGSDNRKNTQNNVKP